MNDFENRLRAHLAEQAQHAPDGDALAEQIITGLDRATVTPIEPHRQWKTWTFPLIAAAAVAAVALALVGVSHLGRTPQHTVADPTTSRTTRTHVQTAPRTTTAPAPTQVIPPPTVATSEAIPLLNHVRVLDLSFVSNDEGWALATADCLDAKSSGKLCTAMLRTTNGGTTWRGVPTPPANVPIGTSCASPCVTHIRFANDRIGYAFGPSTLFMTNDGGTHWTLESGGADALETLDNNVIRVVHQGQGCPPGCVYSVQTAPIGSATWQPVTLPGAASAGMTVGVSLTRTGSAAYLAVFGHTAGGADNARTRLYRSTDDGATWTNGGEPCPSVGASEVDSTMLTSGSDGSVTVLCTPRGPQTGEFTRTAAAGATAFGGGSRSALHSLQASAATAIGSATASTLIVVDDKNVYRSTDSGRTFARLASPAPAGAKWIGFESATAGRAISADGSAIWTTQDAGLTWRAHSFR